MQTSMLGNTRAFQATRVVASRPTRVAVPVIQARVALRFQRFGRKKAPFYRLVAIDSKDRRDGRPLEYLGWYDPLKKETNLKAPEIKTWISNGALPSDTVRSLLQKAMVIPTPVRVIVPVKVVVPKDEPAAAKKA
ncbi:hypothetical protein FOA52_003168 [Chlamydomonas sp. UWO 241]|nr:hypothetical protein FOA52_003168 [Chlamydomonas sp. UWO 241]